MAYMFGNVDEFDEPAPADVDDSVVASESATLRRQMQAVFVGSLCLLPWLAPVAVFGCMVSGAVLLATKPAADCQEQIDTEIKQHNFGCAWLGWVAMALIVGGAAAAGLMAGAETYMQMRGL